MYKNIRFIWKYLQNLFKVIFYNSFRITTSYITVRLKKSLLCEGKSTRKTQNRPRNVLSVSIKLLLLTSLYKILCKKNC